MWPLFCRDESLNCVSYFPAFNSIDWIIPPSFPEKRVIQKCEGLYRHPYVKERVVCAPHPISYDQTRQITRAGERRCKELWFLNSIVIVVFSVSVFVVDWWWIQDQLSYWTSYWYSLMLISINNNKYNDNPTHLWPVRAIREKSSPVTFVNLLMNLA